MPTWLREDPELRAYILELTRHEYADRAETGDRFYQLLGELRRDREEQAQKWDKNQAELVRLHEEIMTMAQRYDRGICALEIETYGDSILVEEL